MFIKNFYYDDSNSFNVNDYKPEYFIIVKGLVNFYKELGKMNSLWRKNNFLKRMHALNMSLPISNNTNILLHRQISLFS